MRVRSTDTTHFLFYQKSPFLWFRHRIILYDEFPVGFVQNYCFPYSGNFSHPPQIDCSLTSHLQLCSKLNIEFAMYLYRLIWCIQEDHLIQSMCCVQQALFVLQLHALDSHVSFGTICSAANLAAFFLSGPCMYNIGVFSPVLVNCSSFLTH